MATLDRLANDSGLDLMVPANAFEINLYRHELQAAVAKWETERMYGSIGHYIRDGFWAFAVMSKSSASPWTTGDNTVNVAYGRIALYAAGDRPQGAWEIETDEAGELASQANYAEFPPVVSWAHAEAE